MSGREISLHTMDRPKRIIDTIEYRVIIDGIKKILYEEEIYDFSDVLVNNSSLSDIFNFRGK